LVNTKLQMIRPEATEQEFQASQTLNIEDKTIEELLQLDPDMFPVITTCFSIIRFHQYIKCNIFIDNRLLFQNAATRFQMHCHYITPRTRW
jgi:DNA-binding XRE family transcriptional regulator